MTEVLDGVQTTGLIEERVTDREITDVMQKNYLSYAMSVIVSRALPDVRDGLKPVHRRILYAMYKVGFRYNASFRKSARIVGEVIGKYHPHGDSSVYMAMVRLAQDFSMRYVLVDGQGNFGSIDGDNPAAARYTEARLKRLSEEMLSDIQKDTVDMQDNYDGQEEEPTVLPAALPSLLLNGVSGIAVGMATQVPPHHLGEVVDATCALVQDPHLTVADLMHYVKGPDFPTGGYVYDSKAMLEAYSTGRGKVITRAKLEIEEDDKGKSKIIVTEIPYQVTKRVLVERIAELIIEKKIVGIADFRDESNRHGIRIVMELRRDAFPNQIVNQLYQLTELQKSYHYNMVVLTERGKQPRLLNLVQILQSFIDHRIEVIVRRTRYDMNEALAREHILEGLKKALDFIDEVIAMIRKSSTKEEAKIALMTRFGLSELQVQAILEMRLQALAGLERQKVEDELAEKRAFIAWCQTLIASEDQQKTVLIEDLQRIKTLYNDARRTQVVPTALGAINIEDTIPEEDMIVTMTDGGYIKRVTPDVYRSQKRGGKGVLGMATKEEDAVVSMATVSTHDDIWFFTDRGRVFKIKAYEVPLGSRTTKGTAVVNLINIDSGAGESVTAMLSLNKNCDDVQYLFMATDHGTVKKTALSEFQNVRKNGLIALSLKPGEKLCWVSPTSGEDHVLLVTYNGMVIQFDEAQVRSMGRNAAGVRGIRLRDGDTIAQMSIVKDPDLEELVVVMEKGIGKRTNLSEYRSQSRGGVGLKVANITGRTGKVVGASVIPSACIDDMDMFLISQQGQMIRTALSSVKLSSRVTQGVTLMRLSDDILTAMSVLVREDVDVIEPLEKEESAE